MFFKLAASTRNVPTFVISTREKLLVCIVDDHGEVACRAVLKVVDLGSAKLFLCAKIVPQCECFWLKQSTDLTVMKTR